MVCPEGYDFFIGDRCIKLVSFPKYQVVNYAPCTERPMETEFRENCAQVCIYNNRLQLFPFDSISNICTYFDNASVVYSVSDNEHSFTDSRFLTYYQFEVLPPACTVVYYKEKGVRTLKLDDHNGGFMTCLCNNTKICQLHPKYKNAASNIGNQHFVLCARTAIDSFSSEHSREVQSFICNDGSIIGETLQSDGIIDYNDAEDEYNCSHVCSHLRSKCFKECMYPACRCENEYYQCINGGCMTFDKLCDGQLDCPLGEDEHGCLATKKSRYHLQSTLVDIDHSTWFCSGQSNYLPCLSKRECYALSSLCHYDTVDGFLMHCADGSHLGQYCKQHVCNHNYKCRLSYCIPTRKVCDQVVDCPEGDDDEHCDNMACPGHLRCSQTTLCVPPHELRDGVKHCPQGDDEKVCMQCPSDCTCRGHLITCDNVHSANISLITPPIILLLNSSYSVFQIIQNNNQQFLEETVYLSLNQGEFHLLLRHGHPTLKYCKSLRYLQLRYQGIKKLFHGFIHSQLVIKLDLSHNVINIVESKAFDNLQDVQILSLDHNKLLSIKFYFCENLRSLKFLYLRDNPLYDVASQILLNSPHIQLISSDWYTVCCILHTVENCEPKGHLISFCNNLLSVVTVKVFIAAQAIFAIFLNGTLLLQHVISKEKRPDRHFS